jgi:hypothetical protein
MTVARIGAPLHCQVLDEQRLRVNRPDDPDRPTQSPTPVSDQRLIESAYLICAGTRVVVAFGTHRMSKLHSIYCGIVVRALAFVLPG